LILPALKGIPREVKKGYFFAGFAGAFIGAFSAVFPDFLTGFAAVVFTSFAGEGFAVAFAGAPAAVFAFATGAGVSLTTGVRAGFWGGVVVFSGTLDFFLAVSTVFFASFAGVFFSINQAPLPDE